METLKSARFWISLVVLAIIGGLAFVGKIGGDVALAALMGIGGGWGIAQAPAKTKTGLLALAFLASVSACGATGLEKARDTLPTVAAGVNLVGSAGMSTLHQYCQTAANLCRANGVTKSQDCPGWKKCEAVRQGFIATVDATADAVSALDNSLKAVEEYTKEVK